MKIRDVTAIYPSYPYPLDGWRGALWQIVVRVETDNGLVGWGYGGGGRASLPIINDHFRNLLIDKPLNSTGDIAQLWEMLYQASIPYGRKGIAIMALSGVDLALWDALGKAKEKPVYEMLGGLRVPEITAYATGSDTAWYVEQGFRACKMPHRWDANQAAEPQYQKTVEQIEEARTLIGPQGSLMLDCYMTWDAQVTATMAELLSPHEILWFEDVLTPDDLASHSSLREEIKPILLAGGEHEFTEHGFLSIAQSRALDVWQPDITWCGGITSMLRIAELARQFDTIVIPHRGGEVWGLHVIAAGHCISLGEVLPGRRDQNVPPLWLDEPQARNGYLMPAIHLVLA